MPSEQTINTEPTSAKSLQDKLLAMLTEELEFDKEYWLPLIFSSIIATLGLLTDNSVVVIGAMLMTPLFWPVFGVTLGTITTRRQVMSRSVLFLLLSVIVVVTVSWLVTIVTPISEISQEIKLRSNPTLLDLFIALSTSIIAILAVSYPQVSNSIAGVAVSIAMLPPLSVVGIGLAFKAWQIFQGSLLLFGANVSAIVFSGIVTLYFLGVKPHRLVEQTRWRIGVTLAAGMLLLVSIPLTIYFREAIEQAQQRRQVRQVLEEQLNQLYDNIRINNLIVNFGVGKDEVDIEATIYLPEGNFLTVSNKNTISEALTDIVDQTVNLQLNVVDTLLLRRQEDNEIREQRRKIETWLSDRLLRESPDIRVQNVEISETGGTDGSAQMTITLTARKYTETPFTFDQKKAIQDELSQTTGIPISLDISFIPVSRVRTQDQITRLSNSAKAVIEQDLSGIDPLARLDKVEIQFLEDQALPEKPQQIAINSVIWLPENVKLSNQEREKIEQNLALELQTAVQLEMAIFRFTPL